jgi:hypothetical protein
MGRMVVKYILVGGFAPAKGPGCIRDPCHPLVVGRQAIGKLADAFAS